MWRGKPLVRHSVEALLCAGADPVVVVIPADTDMLADTALDGLEYALATGMPTRQGSVLAGLNHLADDPPTTVLIHDAARPCVPREIIDRLLHSMANSVAAIPVLPVVDSIITAEGDTMIAAVDRISLRRVQTPQAFRFAEILAAHLQSRIAATDDAQVAREAGHAITMIPGDEALHKVTFASDFGPDQPAMRAGTGFDVHRLAADEELWLCGVKIEHSRGLVGHSDADVGIHAAVDAMLGAAALGDIGDHFPPSDERWRGSSSDQFLSHARLVVDAAGYRLGNLDLTLICEAPRIGPHRAAMRAKLAAILGVDVTAISVKATTSEGLGFAGRGEGIAAQASVLLVRKHD